MCGEKINKSLSVLSVRRGIVVSEMVFLPVRVNRFDESPSESESRTQTIFFLQLAEPPMPAIHLISPNNLLPHLHPPLLLALVMFLSLQHIPEPYRCLNTTTPSRDKAVLAHVASAALCAPLTSQSPTT
jgi:hypothetical protein